MPLILHIDTATQTCSVALSSDSTLLGMRESRDEKSHSSHLVPFIDELLRENQLEASGLDAVAVCKGPGSYTGLRIGVSTAKGIAYGGGIPLIGIGTLDSMVSGILQHPEASKTIEMNADTLLCPMIDARRMEVYTALYLSSGKILEKVSARIIDMESYHERLENGKVVFFGNGAGKCREIIRHSNAVFLDDFEASAAYMISKAEKAWHENRFEDIAYFEPFYLKDFIAVAPKNKILPGQHSAPRAN